MIGARGKRVLLAAFIAIEHSSAVMLDLGPLRVPTFGGGLLAAWAISAALFALCLPDHLHANNSASAVETGVRFSR